MKNEIAKRKKRFLAIEHNPDIASLQSDAFYRICRNLHKFPADFRAYVSA
ncbi:MAG: hypothetical protein V8Q57_09880 [Blautia sp.]